MKIIRVLSWNIWIHGYFDEITDFIKKSNADIICLQEVKDNDPKLDVIKYLSDSGYEHVFAPIEHVWGGKSHIFGSAVFSRHKIISSQILNLHEEGKRPAVRVDIEVGGETLHVFGVHLNHTHKQPSDVQEAQVENLIKVLPPERTIVMGDFNAMPESKTVQKIAKILIDTDPKSLPTWSMYPEGCEKCKGQSL